ncbi:MAG: PatB family C-S lyase [Staphylococcus equorum]|uniref:cysteine-S-conjugate beta-lyase n=1 Tax=Tetragenococcus halophilus subsp. halophilus TaxID=1513897 RepID=A0A2H6CQW4_TETHA|nr:PatB family C-S lyase [Tetragenococcus halophilus]MDN6159843.1 PatB family C-S lyase [Staphylococcus equorum]MDN6161270.1 PatB family C-S lyase [Atopostipes sp.]MDN6266721.1 PatB family C-S lyase [Tetragenococcus koreensis]MDN6730566.1 PatB family C-S lyase [Atopostipes suicloacalis]MDN6670767.1 PatB family C-S lyase [Staphylococcus equorum]
MNRYNFDEVNDRYNTYSTQWDYTQDRFGAADVLPFSISDTDFKAPEEIVEKLTALSKYGIYGYTRWNHEDFKDAICYYYQKRHQVNISDTTIVYSPSVMYTMAVMIRGLSQENDQIVTLLPMYDAFFKVIEENNRTLSASPLLYTDSGYLIDWNDLEQRLQEATIFILCSPHNPTGRVWTQEELAQIIDLCRKYDVWIISDEIHSDIVHTSRPHLPIMHPSFVYKKKILISSASKTFNTPALIGSYALFYDKETADILLQQSRYCDFVNSASLFGMHALMVGYTQCFDYIEELKEYVYNNYEYLKKELARISSNKIELKELESTYLVWFDISNVGVSPEVLQNLLVEKGKLGIMSGIHYGDTNFMRINIGCPRSKLEEAVRRMKIVFKGLNK